MSEQTFGPKPLDPMRVTTRSVPLKCGACEGTGAYPGRDDDDYEPCTPCEGKGWLWITETTTEPALRQEFTNGYRCGVCSQFVMFGTTHYCTGYGNVT